MFKYLTFLFLSLIISCGGISQTEHINLELQQPYVLHAVQTNDNNNVIVDIEFSSVIDQGSFNSNSAYIIVASDYEAYPNWRDLEDANDELSKITLNADWSADFLHVKISPGAELNSKETYILVLLPAILSSNHLPLDQTRDGREREEYTLYLQGSIGDSTPNNGAVNSNEPDNTAENEVVPTEESLPPFDWERVYLSEIVTDPQEDHGDSSGGNGVPFDATPGTGTIGTTDEYLEIYNGSNASVNLSGWSVLMADGTDVTQGLDQETQFSLGGNITDFQPGEFLVIGNPDGDMKNTVTVTLLDENSTEVDSVVLDDANASSLSDESWMRSDDGWNWIAGKASPGF